MSKTIIEIDEASELPEYAKVEKLVAAHMAASGLPAALVVRDERPRDLFGRGMTERIADALGVPRPFMTQEWSGAAMALHQLDAGWRKEYAWTKRTIASCRLGNKFHNQALPKQKPRKRRSGGRLVSKNERRARSR